MQLTFSQFTASDVPGFMALAKLEGWCCDEWEFDFLFRESTGGCFVIRDEDQSVGFGTAIAYGRSGWIGNLIVAPSYRRQGLGRLLMQTLLLSLDIVHVENIWLTASAQGAPLYSSFGFREVDRIERWSCTGYPGTTDEGAPGLLGDQYRLDAQGWGEARHSLIQEKNRIGDVWQDTEAFLIGQSTYGGYQLGPGGGESRAMARLFPAIVEGSHSSILLDVPAGNKAAGALLAWYGFTRCGETVLMCRGDASGYDAGRVFALGSMGSIG